jgi:ubiquinone/menaquinone biosynthesis C-methylase UbiE
MKPESYTPGHSANATDFMAKRSLESHGSFFSPYLRSGLRVLDCGCGPGSITQGIAQRVSPAEVVGVDFGESQVARAKKDAAEHGIENVRFIVASCYNLPFKDASFDSVFSHALLEHLSEPKRALAEFHRVLRPDGHVGVCSPDWGGFVLAPHSSALTAAIDTYVALQSKNGGDVRVGRKLGVYLSESGFSSIQMNARYECYQSLAFIGEYLARQLEQAGCDGEAEALKVWSRSDGGMFAQAWISAVAKK